MIRKALMLAVAVAIVSATVTAKEVPPVFSGTVWDGWATVVVRGLGGSERDDDRWRLSFAGSTASPESWQMWDLGGPCEQRGRVVRGSLDVASKTLLADGITEVIQSQGLVGFAWVERDEMRGRLSRDGSLSVRSKICYRVALGGRPRALRETGRARLVMLGY